jgi:hypothetical protein
MAKDAPTIVADADRVQAEADHIREETVKLIAEVGGRQPTRCKWCGRGESNSVGSRSPTLQTVPSLGN